MGVRERTTTSGMSPRPATSSAAPAAPPRTGGSHGEEPGEAPGEDDGGNTAPGARAGSVTGSATRLESPPIGLSSGSAHAVAMPNLRRLARTQRRTLRAAGSGSGSISKSQRRITRHPNVLSRESTSRSRSLLRAIFLSQ